MSAGRHALEYPRRVVLDPYGDDRNATLTNRYSYSALWPWSRKRLRRASSTVAVGIYSNVLKSIRSTHSSASGRTRLTKPRMTPAQPQSRRGTQRGTHRGAAYRPRERQPCTPRRRISLAGSFEGPQNPNAATRFGLYAETASRQRSLHLVGFDHLGGNLLACAGAMLECPILRRSVQQVVRPLAGSVACPSRI